MILSDVCEFIVDCPHSTAPDEGKGYPLIRTPNVGKGRLDLNGVHRVSESVYKQRIQRGAPRTNDLIFAREAPAGNVALVQENQTVCLGQRTVLIRPNVQKVNPQYLVYYLLSPKPQYELLGTANGATVTHVNLPAIRNLKIELPEKSVQDKIGTILVTYDDLIENNQKQIKLLEEAAQRLYKEWFVDLNFPGHENTKFVDGVPEGWSKSTVGNICKLRKVVITPDKIESNTPYIGLEHMPRNDICLSTWGKSEEINSNKFIYLKKDVLFGKIRPYFHKVGFALNDGITSTDTMVMVADQNLWGLLLVTVSSDAFVDFSYQNCKEGAKMPRADWKQMEKYAIMIADQATQKLFEQEILVITNKISALAFQCRSLREARDRMLPKLMGGEVEA